MILDKRIRIDTAHYRVSLSAVSLLIIYVRSNGSNYLTLEWRIRKSKSILSLLKIVSHFPNSHSVPVSDPLWSYAPFVNRRKGNIPSMVGKCVSHCAVTDSLSEYTLDAEIEGFYDSLWAPRWWLLSQSPWGGSWIISVYFHRWDFWARDLNL